MSWDCPHVYWFKEHGRLTNICQLNKVACTPTRGKCVLRGKVKLISTNTGTENQEDKQ